MYRLRKFVMKLFLLGLPKVVFSSELFFFFPLMLSDCVVSLGLGFFFFNFVGKHEVVAIWKTKSLIWTVWVAVHIEKPGFFFLLENTDFH